MSPRIRPIRPTRVDCNPETPVPVARDAQRSMDIGFGPRLAGWQSDGNASDDRLSLLDSWLERLEAPGAGYSGELNDGVSRARELKANGKIELAQDVLLELVNDHGLDKADRAVAALEIACMLRTVDSIAAEVFYLRAIDIDPVVPGSQRLRLQLLVDGRETRRALDVVEDLLRDEPSDISLLRTKANLLIQNAQSSEGLAVAQRATELARAGGDQNVIRLTIFTLSYALSRERRSAEAVELYRELLAVNPKDIAAHQGISEYVLPDFTGPHRASIDALFDEANADYMAGRFADARARAYGILALDGDEGLAHKMVRLATSAESRAAREEKAGGPKFIGPLDTVDKRRALVSHFEMVCGRASIEAVSQQPARAATPRDLFPAWDVLTELQRATVAFSILGYGELIAELIEAGARYELAMPGQSCAELDPKMTLDKSNAFGRCFYSIRGWQRGTFSVTGIEAVERAARGGYNTLTHEFAHMVHRHAMTVASQRQRAELVGYSADELGFSERQVHLADTTLAITENFQRARDGQNGQALLDEYSGHNDFEYFAQAMMSYLTPVTTGLEEVAPRLYGRNPEMFELVRAFTERYRSFPSESPAIDHPRVGQEAAGRPRTLSRLLDRAKDAELRTMAKSVLSRIERHCNPDSLDVPEYELPFGYDDIGYRELLLRWAGDLAKIDAGVLPSGHLPNHMVIIGVMNIEELTSQVAALRRRMATRSSTEVSAAELGAVQEHLAAGRIHDARTILTRVCLRLDPPLIATMVA